MAELSVGELKERLDSFPDFKTVHVVPINDGLEDSPHLTIDDVSEDEDIPNTVILWGVDKHEELKVDPYGTVVGRMRQLLDTSMDDEHAAHMNLAEFNTLARIAKCIRDEDPGVQFAKHVTEAIKELED